MDNEYVRLQQWLKVLNDFELPNYKDLPDKDMYMEHVLEYLNGVLKPMTQDAQTEVITSFMINNYVKAKIVEEPSKKKYNKNQLGYLIAISVLKQILSMSNISLLFEMDRNVSKDKPELYKFFKKINDDIVHDQSKHTKDKVDVLLKKYEIEIRREYPNAEINLESALGYIALQLSIEAELNKLIAERILSAISKSTKDESVISIENSISSKTQKRVRKINKSETMHLVKAKKQRLKTSQNGEK